MPNTEHEARTTIPQQQQQQQIGDESKEESLGAGTIYLSIYIYRIHSVLEGSATHRLKNESLLG